MELLATHSISAAEKLLREVEQAKAGHLLISTKSSGNAAGGEAAVAQALVTWAQQIDHATLATHARDPSDPQIEDLPRRLVGLTAALLCDEATAKDKSKVGPALKRAALERLAGLQSWAPREASRGPQIEILCADHLDRSFPATLYESPSSGTWVVRPAKAFKDLGKMLLGTVMLPGMIQSMPRGFADAIGDALYELFRNTHQHALKDLDGNYLRRSIRGIHARRHSLEPAALTKMLTTSPALLTYCQQLKTRSGRRNIELVEFSVFDSGPGLAAKWLKRGPSDADEELMAIRACFERHASSLLVHGRGMGLPIVIAALRERGGFLRLRTGRRSLYANLRTDRGAPFGTLPELLEWPAVSRVAHASGTLMTFLVPIEDRP